MIAALLALFIQAADLPPDQRLDQAVASLGRDDTPWADNTIAQYRCAAVPRLVRELRIMPPGHYLPIHQSFSTQHYLQVIGALRTITGRDFYGSADRRQMAHFSELARFFLEEFAPAGKVKPVAIWPSHGALYIAPISAQRQIVREWRSFARSDACRWPGGRHHLQPNWSFTGDMNHLR